MPSRSEYIRSIVSRLVLPSEYDCWLADYSQIIPQKSITTNVDIYGDDVDVDVEDGDLEWFSLKPIPAFRSLMCLHPPVSDDLVNLNFPYD